MSDRNVDMEDVWDDEISGENELGFGHQVSPHRGALRMFGTFESTYGLTAAASKFRAFC